MTENDNYFQQQEGISVKCQQSTFQLVPGGPQYDDVQMNEFEHVWGGAGGPCIVF